MAAPRPAPSRPPHTDGLDFPRARQAIKITRWRQDTATGRISRETLYAITTLTSAHATAADLARLIREHWTIEAHHHIRDMTFSEDTSTKATATTPAMASTSSRPLPASSRPAGIPGCGGRGPAAA